MYTSPSRRVGETWKLISVNGWLLPYDDVLVGAEVFGNHLIDQMEEIPAPAGQ